MRIHSIPSSRFGTILEKDHCVLYCIFSCECVSGQNHVCVSPDEARAQRSFQMGANCIGERSDAGYRLHGSSKRSAVVQVSVLFRSGLIEFQQQ